MAPAVEVVLQGAGRDLQPGARLFQISALVRAIVAELLQEASGRFLAGGPSGVFPAEASVGLIVQVGLVDRAMLAPVGRDVDIAAPVLPALELVWGRNPGA